MKRIQRQKRYAVDFRYYHLLSDSNRFIPLGRYTTASVAVRKCRETVSRPDFVARLHKIEDEGSLTLLETYIHTR